MSNAMLSEKSPHPEPGWLTRNKLAIAPWIFLIPALIFFAIYVVIPIFREPLAQPLRVERIVLSGR